MSYIVMQKTVLALGQMLKEEFHSPGVDFINCFTPYAELSRLAPVKSFSKVGRRARKLGVGAQNCLWNWPQVSFILVFLYLYCFCDSFSVLLVFLAYLFLSLNYLSLSACVFNPFDYTFTYFCLLFLHNFYVCLSVFSCSRLTLFLYFLSVYLSTVTQIVLPFWLCLFYFTQVATV